MNSHRLRRKTILHRRRTSRTTTRAGFTLTEMFATFAMLGVAISLAVPMLGAIARQRVAIEQRQFAIQHAENLLEQQTARPFAELTPGEQPLESPGPEWANRFPDFEQSAVVTELPGTPATRRITVSLRWTGHSGIAVNPVQLSGWVTSPEGK